MNGVPTMLGGSSVRESRQSETSWLNNATSIVTRVDMFVNPFGTSDGKNVEKTEEYMINHTEQPESLG